jgi:signal transduction histidine kinase
LDIRGPEHFRELWRLEPAHRAAANRQVAVSLRISLLMLTLVMAALPVSHAVLVAPEARPTVQAVALASAAVFFLLYLAMCKGLVQDRHADAVGFLVVCVLLCLPATHLVLGGAMRQSTNFVLIVCAAGCILLSPCWLAAAIGATLATWTYIVALIVPGPDWPHFALTLVLATILSGGLQLLHLVHLRRNETLQAQLARGLKALGASESRHRQLSETQGVLIQQAEKREAYLRCLTGISRLLLEHDHPQDAFPETIARLRGVSQADRCYLFACTATEDGEVSCTQQHEVCAPGVPPQSDNPELQGLPLRETGYGRWIDVLRAGGALRGEVAAFPAPERALLEAQAIHSLLVLPLHVHGRWWGFIGFDACRPRLSWSEDDASLLQTAANLMGAALARAETEFVVRQQRAQMLEQSKNSLLWTMGSGVAHEINNPLAIISGASEGIAEQLDRGDPDAGSLRTLSGRIARNVQRIAHIVRGLRTLSRDASEDPVELRPLTQILDDALELCRARMHARQIRLDVAPIPDDLVLECRATQISQVVINLLNNAFDAVADADTRWIRVEAGQMGDTVWFSVADSGPGLGQADLSRLFDPFYTTKPPGRGMGVGLSITRGIVTRHHGDIALDTTSPHTRFVVRMPCRQDADMVPAPTP